MLVTDRDDAQFHLPAFITPHITVAIGTQLLTPCAKWRQQPLLERMEAVLFSRKRILRMPLLPSCR
jgi:hypothetical protein